MSNADNNDTGRVFNVPDDGIQPREVRYVDQETPARFRTSALSQNNSYLIRAEQEDRSLFAQTMAIVLIIIIIILCIVRLERGKTIELPEQLIVVESSQISSRLY